MRLALALCSTVEDLETEMPYTEYLDWMKFYALEPWGTAVEDDRAAKVINYMLASQYGSEHKWIETKHLFPRHAADLKDVAKPVDDDPEVMAASLRSFFQDRNARLAAKEPDQTDTP